MTTIHLLSTESSSIHAATGVDGIPVHQLLPQLAALLKARLSVRHQRLFAKPVESDGRRDWYAPRDLGISDSTAIKRLDQLPSDARSHILEDVTALWADIEHLAQTDQQLGHRHRRALMQMRPHLDFEHLYIVDQQPICTHWGLGLEATAGKGALEDNSPMSRPSVAPSIAPQQRLPDPAMTEPHNPVRRRPTIARWLPLLLLPLGLWWYLQHQSNTPAGAPTSPETARVSPEATIEAKEELMRRLSGRWRVSPENKMRDEDNIRLLIEYEFDATGHGTRKIRRENGDKCAGPAVLEWVDQRSIRIRSAPATCYIGSGFIEEVVVCQPSRERKPAQCTQRDRPEVDNIVLLPVTG